MREKFIDQKFRASSLKVIEQADAIITEYQRRGYTLTLRQLYYQFVSKGLLENTLQNYKRLGGIVNDARLAGLLDWSGMEDRTRNVRRVTTWNSPEAIIAAVAAQYREDPWHEQPSYVEVWIEKDALVGVIEGVCNEFRVPYFACRGYPSQSELYDAGKRLARVQRNGLQPIILHLGDHDPSGLDMTRDANDRLAMFMRSAGADVRRLALNMAQVEEYDPPPNPAKDTDARFEAYRDEFGDSSWELDALDPDVIAGLIRDSITGIIDSAAWEESMSHERENLKALKAASENWSDVVNFLEDQGHLTVEDDNEEL